MHAKVPSEYRPVATIRIIRLFYKRFAYMILGRAETQLETHQPEKQHSFRGGRRVEEHLVTTHLILDKLSGANVPIWIASLDLVKAFDRVHWPALCVETKRGKLLAAMVAAGLLPYTVEYDKDLSQRLFCSVLEKSMANWCDEMQHLGLDLCDGGRSLLVLRFADAILIFGTADYHSLKPVRASRTATVRKGHGNRIHYSIIMVLNKTAQKPVHGTTIVPHDGQHSSMMNEKHVRKKPEVDHPIASVDDLGAYEVVHGNLFHKNSQGAILNKELANDSLYKRSLPQNGICPSESSQATISLDKFGMRSPVFDSFLTSHHAIHH